MEDGAAFTEELPDQTLRLLRLYGRYAEVTVPEEIGGKTVTEIGTYCFSEKVAADFSTELPEGVYPLCGDTIESLILPDTVRLLSAHAFYNCRRMRSLSVGVALCAVENDALMNCKSLRYLTIRGSCTGESGLRYFLSQLRSEVEVTFLQGKEVSARLLYPDFSESFEEISPAHIFGLHVEGEGYRARKQFEGNRLDFSGYDRVFFKASYEESVDTLFRMAVYRLLYPVGLKEGARQDYEAFLSREEGSVLEKIVREKKEEELSFLCESGLLTEGGRRAAVRLAAKSGWMRGNLILMKTFSGGAL